MAYTPSLNDIPENAGYTPSLADIDEISNATTPKQSLLSKVANGALNYEDKGGAAVLAGTAKMGNDLLNIPHNIANAISPKLGGAVPGYKPDFNYMQAMGITNPNLMQKSLALAPQMLPYIAGGEAAGLAKAPEFIGTVTKSAPAMVQKAAGLAGMVGKNALFGGGASIASGGNFLPGAEMGADGGLAGAVINAGINALRPSQLLAGNLTSPELAQNLNVTQGTNTPLGDVIGSPMTKRLYENVLTKIPGSGANEQLQKTAGQIVGQGNDIMGQLLGNNAAGDVGATLQQSLKQKLNELQQIKRNNYALPNNIADQMGLTVGRDNFSQTAKNTLDEIKASPELAREVDPSILNDLQNYSDPSMGNSLKLSNIFKGKIGDKASDYFTNNQNYEYGIYKNLKDSLQKDIDSSITGSGNADLQNAHAQANQFYKDNIAPFEDPNIVKFTKQGGDADTLLSAFIKSGRTNDRGNLINTLVNKLPADQQNLPAYGWFSKALDQNGNLDPQKFSRIYNNLGVKQKAALIPDVNLRAQLDNYTNLVSKNAKALTLMQNPATGQQNMDLVPALLAHVGAASTGGLAGYQTAGLPGAFAGSVLGGIAGLGVSAAASRPIAALLTNPSVRTNLVKAMIANRTYAPVGNKMLGGIAGIPGVMNNE
jgi:hypothetical protein